MERSHHRRLGQRHSDARRPPTAFKEPYMYRQSTSCMRSCFVCHAQKFLRHPEMPFCSCFCCGASSAHQKYEPLEQSRETALAGNLALPVFGAMWCRSSGKFVLDRVLDQIGARRFKSFSLVKENRQAFTEDGTQSEGIMGWLFGNIPQLVLTVTACSFGAHERYHVRDLTSNSCLATYFLNLLCGLQPA